MHETTVGVAKMSVDSPLAQIRPSPNAPASAPSLGAGVPRPYLEIPGECAIRR